MRHTPSMTAIPSLQVDRASMASPGPNAWTGQSRDHEGQALLGSHESARQSLTARRSRAVDRSGERHGWSIPVWGRPHRAPRGASLTGWSIAMRAGPPGNWRLSSNGLIVRQRSNRRGEKRPPEGLFGDARVVESSLSYFPVRGLNPTVFPDLSRAVRFAPRCWHAASKAETPALIVALTDEAGQVRAIQRLYLTADCRAKACKPMSLGKISGLAIKLGPPTDTLYVAEGLKDAMTAQQASNGESSAWAAAGSSNMPNLVVPDAVRTVIFLGQNDKDDPNQRDKTFEQNLAKAAPKLMREGKAVRVAWPPASIKDINDLVKGRTGAALSEGYADVKQMIDSAAEVLPADD